MQLTCRLIDIAASDYSNIEDIYINTRNASRFTKENDNEEFHDLYLHDLRREKAYQLLWESLSQNMRNWWD